MYVTKKVFSVFIELALCSITMKLRNLEFKIYASNLKFEIWQGRDIFPLSKPNAPRYRDLTSLPEHQLTGSTQQTFSFGKRPISKLQF